MADDRIEVFLDGPTDDGVFTATCRFVSDEPVAGIDPNTVIHVFDVKATDGTDAMTKALAVMNAQRDGRL